jgi:hypothetical protein
MRAMREIQPAKVVGFVLTTTVLFLAILMGIAVVIGSSYGEGATPEPTSTSSPQRPPTTDMIEDYRVKADLVSAAPMEVRVRELELRMREVERQMDGMEDYR